MSNKTRAGSKTIRFVNVIMHGAFGYVFDRGCISAYSPACFGHMYVAGGHDIHAGIPLKQGVDYELTGVKSESSCSISLDASCNPVLSLAKTCIARNEVDSFKKRFTMIRLPYPARRDIERPKLMFGVSNAYVGEIYSGKSQNACGPLNAMNVCPSLQIFVYELHNSADCVLQPISGKAQSVIATEVSHAPDTLNFHVFCSKDPSMLGNKCMTEEGHTRRMFASLVDMFGGLELALNFPDGFHPARPPKEDLPTGVTEDDVDPGRPKGPFNPFFGHVNCGSGNIIFVA